jgi:hypothetical protein
MGVPSTTLTTVPLVKPPVGAVQTAVFSLIASAVPDQALSVKLMTSPAPTSTSKTNENVSGASVSKPTIAISPAESAMLKPL